MGFFSSWFTASLIPSIANFETKLSDRERFNFGKKEFERSLFQITKAIRMTESQSKKRDAIRRLERLCNHGALDSDERQLLQDQVNDLRRNC